jgi:hypothetical protein
VQGVAQECRHGELQPACRVEVAATQGSREFAQCDRDAAAWICTMQVRARWG